MLSTKAEIRVQLIASGASLWCVEVWSLDAVEESQPLALGLLITLTSTG